MGWICFVDFLKQTAVSVSCQNAFLQKTEIVDNMTFMCWSEKQEQNPDFLQQ